MIASRGARIVAGVAALLAAFGAGAATVAAAGGDAARAHGDAVIDQAISTIEAHAAHPVPRSRLEHSAISGMLAALNDQWANYYDRAGYARMRQLMAGSYTGVGLWLQQTSGGALRVLSVQPGSSAHRSGVHSGDRIIAVAGAPVAGRTVAQVSDQLRGASGTEIRVTVANRAGRIRTLVLRRSHVADNDVTTTMLSRTVERIHIAAFTAGVGARVRTLVAQAQARHLAGLVLDLRDDPGGLLDEAVETASAFLRGGPVVTYVQRGEPPRTLDVLGRGNTSIPLVVLVDGGTASAAEIVAAALQERGRAVLLGSQTFGKGTVQAPEPLANGGAVELTVGHYLTPSGRSLEGVGILPDVLIPPGTSQSIVAARALEVLSGLTADAGSSGRG